MLVQVLYGMLSIFVVVSLGASVWYLTRLPAFTISDIAVSGGETVPHDEIRALVEKELTGSYLLLIPHRFIYLYPHEHIMDALNSIPRVQSASVVTAEGPSLAITFSEYEPEALWCLFDESCYFMDASGYAFAEAPQLNGGSFVRHYFEGEDELTEKQVLAKDSLERVNSFIAVLERELDFRIAKVVHTKDGDIIYYIGGGGELLTSPSVGIETTYENLKSVLESEEFSHLTPGNFKYIDLRFGSKVYVNEEFESATSTEKSEEPHDGAAPESTGV